MCIDLHSLIYGATKHVLPKRRIDLSASSPNVRENASHPATDLGPPWKKELNDRLAATRTRRMRHQGDQAALPLPGLDQLERKADSRASQLAAKVAERYANAPSYSEVLAAEAVARAEARRVEAKKAEARKAMPPVPAPPVPVVTEEPKKPEKAIAIEEEPVFVAVEPLATSVVEFPRELVAPRKARPRLAEGPLQTGTDQLKIFEVSSETISKTVSVGKPPAGWSPIRLDDELPAAGEPVSSQIPLKTASLEDRMMAAIFDGALVVSAFVLFVLVFVACTAHPPTGKPALLGAAFVLVGFGILYHYLFFKYAEGTPGMRYAKIALCTFDDENPTRQAMCRRVLFLLLSAAPLGLGFAWAWFDPDRLGWHDRMSRIYQRSYS
jgi:uncharacterized RDD family membrane protein YckC